MAMAEKKQYARNDLLVEPKWVEEHLHDSDVCLIDCRLEDAYRRGHIPQGVRIPVPPETAGPNPLWLKDPVDPKHVMDAGHFADLMSRAGVSNDSTVVCYSDKVMYATRLWWALIYYGHKKAKVLNGGWERWRAEGRAVSTNEEKPAPSRFNPTIQPKRIILFAELKERFAEPHIKLLNLLPHGYWSGADNPVGNRHPGHIPGAANIDSDHFLDQDGNFKSAAELEAMLSIAGISTTDEVVAHCQAGVRTTVGFFVLSILGSDSVRAYDGAMAEWGNRDDVPVETGVRTMEAKRPD
jgi:thiosulfate/3-mercaptopyruvate sulfurtransferase